MNALRISRKLIIAATCDLRALTSQRSNLAIAFRADQDQPVHGLVFGGERGGQKT